MLERSRAFESLPADEEVEAPQKAERSADVIPIDRQALEAEKKGYATYQALGGRLSQPEYEHIVEKAAVNRNYVASARSYARVAGIELSDEVSHLYALLRDHTTPDVPDTLASLSDHKLLAEVLRIKGERTALEQMKAGFPHIDF